MVLLNIITTLALVGPAQDAGEQWLKTAPHVHTYHSFDANAFLELVADRYRRGGFRAVIETEHFALPSTGAYIQMNDGGQSRTYYDGGTHQILDYQDAMPGRLVLDGGSAYWNRGPAECKGYLEDSGILLVAGEEVSDEVVGQAAHFGAWAIASTVNEYDATTSIDAAIVANAGRIHDAAVEPEAGVSRPLVALHHPNYADAAINESDFQAADIDMIEIYNGIDTAANGGTAQSESVRRKWDRANYYRQSHSLPYIWGTASDDAHHYQGNGTNGECTHSSSACGTSSIKRGWISVRGGPTTSEAQLLASIVAGDFYASTGCELSGLTYSGGCITISTVNANARLDVIGVGRSAFAAGAIYSAVGSISSYCPSATAYAFARVEAWCPDGTRAWTQPMDL